MKVKMKNEYGAIKEAPIGFSWTTLVFGCLVPLLRGDFKWAAITFLLAAVSGGLSWFIVPFFYNKVYLDLLVDKGYKAYSKEDLDIIRAKGLLNPVRLAYLENITDSVNL